MPVINLKSGVFDALENAATLPQVELDHQQALDTLSDGFAVGDPVVLQLSASLIRVSQVFEEWTGSGFANTTFEMRISGAGIKPVKTLDALLAAIDNGLATGALNQMQILRAGVAVLELTLDGDGYVLSSGALAVHLDGQLPLTFTQFYDLGGLLNDLANVQSLSAGDRNALFDKLGAYAVTGLSVLDGADVLFGFEVLATSASLTVNGLTISLTGTFPGDLGEEMKLLYQMNKQLEASGTIDVDLLSNFDVTGLTITDARGAVMGQMANPLDGTPVAWRMDGKSVDEVVVGSMDNDRFVSGAPGAVKSAVAGLGGNDWLYGGSSKDMLYGGGGRDQLFGGVGADKLMGGAGRDVLTGGAQADVFVFTAGSGSDVITDFQAGLDQIEIRAANLLSDLTFTDTGRNVRIEYRATVIIVEDIEVDQLRVEDNFIF
jgi:Ca2+-binding RTX toxin-like protein